MGDFACVVRGRHLRVPTGPVISGSHAKVPTRARPSTGRQTSGRAKIHREVARDVSAAQRPFSGKIASMAETGREITQIYEGTNQIQRMVMARALLKG